MRGGDEDTAVSRPIARASPSPLGAQRSPAGGAHISTGRLRSTQSLAHLGQSQITATGTGLAVAQLQWHGAAGSPRSSGCLSGSSGGNRAAFGLIITLSVLSCTGGDIPGPANTLWNLGVVLGAIPSAKTKRVLSLKAISTLNLIALGARRPQQSSLQMPFVPAPLPTQAASSPAPVLGENLSLLSKSDREINTELSLLRRKKQFSNFATLFLDQWGSASCGVAAPPLLVSWPGSVTAAPEELSHFPSPAFNYTQHQAEGRGNNRKSSGTNVFKPWNILQFTFALTHRRSGTGRDVRSIPPPPAPVMTPPLVPSAWGHVPFPPQDLLGFLFQNLRAVRGCGGAGEMWLGCCWLRVPAQSPASSSDKA